MTWFAGTLCARWSSLKPLLHLPPALKLSHAWTSFLDPTPAYKPGFAGDSSIAQETADSSSHTLVLLGIPAGQGLEIHALCQRPASRSEAPGRLSWFVTVYHCLSPYLFCKLTHAV